MANVKLDWHDESAGAFNFAIERAEEDGIFSTPIAPIGTVSADVNTFTDVDVPPGVHFYRVREYLEDPSVPGGINFSDPSNTVQVAILAAPSNLVATIQ